jgi:hypothetical protein
MQQNGRGRSVGYPEAMCIAGLRNLCALESTGRLRGLVRMGTNALALAMAEQGRRLAEDKLDSLFRSGNTTCKAVRLLSTIQWLDRVVIRHRTYQEEELTSQLDDLGGRETIGQRSVMSNESCAHRLDPKSTATHACTVLE